MMSRSRSMSRWVILNWAIPEHIQEKRTSDLTLVPKSLDFELHQGLQSELTVNSNCQRRRFSEANFHNRQVREKTLPVVFTCLY